MSERGRGILNWKASAAFAVASALIADVAWFNHAHGQAILSIWLSGAFAMAAFILFVDCR